MSEELQHGKVTPGRSEGGYALPRRGALALPVALALLALAEPARAQPPDPAMARALLETANTAMKKGDWTAACPIFAASFAAQPTVGALLEIAGCHVHEGKLTLAADDYQRLLSLNEDTLGGARRKALAKRATDALAALQTRLPKLRIVASAPPPDLRVTRDDVPVSVMALGLEIPVDPGEHVVVASAPGWRTETLRVTLAEGRASELTLHLVPEPPAPVAVAPPEPIPAPPLAPPVLAPPLRPAPPPPAPRTWGWAALSAGILLDGLAIFFAVDGAAANCGGPCFAASFTQADIDTLNARRHRDLGLGLGFGLTGVAGVALGAFAIATAPKPGRTPARLSLRPWMARDQAGIGLQGGF